MTEQNINDDRSAEERKVVIDCGIASIEELKGKAQMWRSLSCVLVKASELLDVAMEKIRKDIANGR